MSEEERIAIYETESKIIEGDYGDFYNTIPRTEAIERMAKAMAADDVAVEGYKVLAEAALNALIGDKK